MSFALSKMKLSANVAFIKKATAAKNVMRPAASMF